MIAYKQTLAPGLLVALMGCQNLPHFDDVSSPQKVTPKVSEIVDEVQCEILRALRESDPTLPQYDAELAELQNGQYVASVDLTLDVTNDEGFNPSLSYIEPFHTTGTEFLAGVDGQLKGEQHRNINVNFTLLFDRNTPTGAVAECPANGHESALRGDLGIKEILKTGLRYETDQLTGNVYPYKLPAIGVGTLLAVADPLTGSPTLAPNFGSTVDFSLVYGVDGGPNWTLKQFVGPSPSSGGLLDYTRTNKETLVIAFARVSPTTPPSSGTADQSAARAAQDSISRMILQRLSIRQ